MLKAFTVLGITDYRNTNKVFGIKDKDRLQHIYCLGKSGTGKSTLLKNMAFSDIQRSNGICVLDPHGDLSEELLSAIPKHRKDDVIYITPASVVNTVCYNPLYNIPKQYHHLVTSGLISTFKKIWFESWGVRMEHILRFSLLTLLQYPKATLLSIQPLLTDLEFRTQVLNYVTDKHILGFWKNEFDTYSPKFRNEVIAPILNKVGLFSANQPLRSFFGVVESNLSVSSVMNQSKILICNLAKGLRGEEASSILGSILLTAIQNAALFRAKSDTDKRSPFYVYIDEAHSFLSLSTVDMLSESRKYGVSLFLTHQYLEQLDERIRKAIFGNVGTVISFRVGAADAEYLAKEFYPICTQDDFIHLPRHALYIRLMIDGTTSSPFSAISLPPDF